MRNHFLRAATGKSLYDTDAQTYITAVETADGQALETATKDAINDFVVGCKADGIWTAIKASCILAGARTLAGALVPLVGTKPTNVGFSSGNYNRKLGIINSVAAYIDSNYNHAASAQNDISMSVFLGSVPTISGSTFIGIGGGSTGASNIFGSSGGSLLGSRSQSSNYSNVSFPSGTKNFLGTSRSASGSYTFRYNGANTTISIVSQAPYIGNVWVFVDNAANNYYISFYHVGQVLTLSALDTRIATLINAINVAF